MNQLVPRIEFVLQALFRKQLNCPHCGSKDYNRIARKYISVSIENCNKCNLMFTSPIYKSLIFSELYDKLYKAEGSTTDMPTSEQLSKLTSENFQGSDKYFGDRIKLISQITEGRDLLEIGSSWGYFLWQAKKMGFQTTGVELSDTRRRFGIDKLDVNLVKTTTELGERKFDIIYTAHTLEHFTDLTKIFQDISDHLKVAGKVIIEVPNFDFAVHGNSLLSVIGAVHPIGFCSEFFQQNLPKYGLSILGFYDSWKNFPLEKTSKSDGNIVLLVAEKVFNES